MSEREEAWQVSPLGRMVGHHGIASDEPLGKRPSCSDDYKLGRK